LSDAVVHGRAKCFIVAGVDREGQDPTICRFDEANGLGEVVGSSWRVGDTGRQLVGDVNGNDVGTLIGHADGMRRSGDECHFSF